MAKWIFGVIIGVGVLIVLTWIGMEIEKDEARREARAYAKRIKPRADGTVPWVKVRACCRVAL